MSGYNEIMIVAGEASGDRHASRLVERLSDREPALRFFGSAGHRMSAVGVDSVVDFDGLSIVGPIEIARALPMFLRTFRTLLKAATERRPVAAILVDFPEFNLRLARSLRKAGIPVIYYISPQLWAWRQYRVKTIRDSVDLLLAILPFEKEWYSRRGVDHVVYVGNPLAHEVHATVGRDEYRESLKILADEKLVALLPGSRHKEITRILPVMLESVEQMLLRDANVRFAVAAANRKCRADIENILAVAALKTNIAIVEDQTYDLLNAADAAAVTSGTATLETGIIGTPMAVVYKTSAINYALVAPLIDVEHYGLINLIAGKRIVRELIQDELTPSSLSAELIRLLDPVTNREVREQLQAAAENLGSGGATEKAADTIIEFLSQR